MGGVGELLAAAEGFQLQKRKALETFKIKEAAREAFLFRFLAAQLGFRNQPRLFALAQNPHDHLVGGNGFGDEGALFKEAEDAEVGLSDLGGHEEAAGMEIPEGGPFGSASGLRQGSDPAEKIYLPRYRSRAGPGC